MKFLKWLFNIILYYKETCRKEKIAKEIAKKQGVTTKIKLNDITHLNPLVLCHNKYSNFFGGRDSVTYNKKLCVNSFGRGQGAQGQCERGDLGGLYSFQKFHPECPSLIQFK